MCAAPTPNPRGPSAGFTERVSVCRHMEQRARTSSPLPLASSGRQCQAAVYHVSVPETTKQVQSSTLEIALDDPKR
jgi:hypothetical protein